MRCTGEVKGRRRFTARLEPPRCGARSCSRSQNAKRHPQQGRGHTADRDEPLTFDRMAEDTAAVLRALNVSGADAFGYSNGGVVALRLAILGANAGSLSRNVGA
jgi:pimeloyl-ACP methyl ester carboxylesterase